MLESKVTYLCAPSEKEGVEGNHRRDVAHADVSYVDTSKMSGKQSVNGPFDGWCHQTYLTSALRAYSNHKRCIQVQRRLSVDTMTSQVLEAFAGSQQLIQRHRQLFYYSPIAITQSSAATSELQSDE